MRKYSKYVETVNRGPAEDNSSLLDDLKDFCVGNKIKEDVNQEDEQQYEESTLLTFDKRYHRYLLHGEELDKMQPSTFTSTSGRSSFIICIHNVIKSINFMTYYLNLKTISKATCKHYLEFCLKNNQSDNAFLAGLPWSNIRQPVKLTYMYYQSK